MSIVGHLFLVFSFLCVIVISLDNGYDYDSDLPILSSQKISVSYQDITGKVFELEAEYEELEDKYKVIQGDLLVGGLGFGKKSQVSLPGPQPLGAYQHDLLPSDNWSDSLSPLTVDLQAKLPKRVWKGGLVPFVVADKFTLQEKKKILFSINRFNHLMRKNNIRVVFKPSMSTDLSSFLFIAKTNQRCFSSLGNQGQKSAIGLATNCLGEASVFHQLMHSLGFLHEYSMENRDQHVQFNSQNVKLAELEKFKTWPGLLAQDSYDPHSIMHSGSYEYSVNGQPVFKKNNGDVFDSAISLSQHDIVKIKNVYGEGLAEKIVLLKPQSTGDYDFDLKNDLLGGRSDNNFGFFRLNNWALYDYRDNQPIVVVKNQELWNMELNCYDAWLSSARLVRSIFDVSEANKLNSSSPGRGLASTKNCSH